MPISHPPTIEELEHRRLAEVTKDWSTANGLVVRPPPAVVSSEADPLGILATSVPVTLFPSPFPELCFEQAKNVQKTYNELYARISQDEQFIGRIVKEVVDGDEFIGHLWNIHERVQQEGYVQDLSLGMFRSDYMVHQDLNSTSSKPQIKQVEFNTIASSFGGLSSKTSALHKFLATTEYPLLKKNSVHTSWNLPHNGSAQGLANGLRTAWRAYGKSELGHETCVIFLVQGVERNVYDQRHVEYELQVTGNTPVFRLAFAEITERTSIANADKRQLLYHPPANPSAAFEVAVVYFRAGYGPSDYPDACAWDARYHLERSAAIKCPTVLTQLAGMKKVQQVLATPKVGSDTSSVLGRFIPEDGDNADAFSALWATFTNIFPMDHSAEGALARKLALDAEDCKRYVLKPQREGGGNNHYRTTIPTYLRSVPESHWSSYILMELITPPPVTNTILRNGQLEQGGVICELGRFGTCLWDQRTRKILHNEDAGYLLRTKGDQSEEGGVAAGFGCMDSCNLV